MRFKPTPISGAFIVELEPRLDDRGAFARVFCRNEFADQGIEFDTAQCNLATTLAAGTVRGLHFQEPPAGEQKLVRCVAGEVFDAVVDMRSDSPTYLNKFTIGLSAANQLALFVPAGIAHGYQALEDHSQFLYMTDEFYSPGHEKGVRYDDPFLNIPWPLPPINVTDRDRAWPLLKG